MKEKDTLKDKHEQGSEEKVKRIDSATDKARAREKDSDRLKVEENVRCSHPKILYTLSIKETKAMGGAISTGKEANVFYAEGDERTCNKDI